MLSSAEFKAFASEYVVFAHVTTRIKDRKDDGLLQQKGGTGFPYLVALNADGDVIARLNGARTLEGFRTMMADGAKFESIRNKAEKTTDDQLFLLKHDIAMGQAKLAAAKERIAGLGKLTEAQQKEADGILLGLEIMDLVPNARDPAARKAQVEKAGIAFAEMWKAGREPVSDDHAGPFYMVLLDHAEAQKDASLFEKALGKLRERFGKRAGSEGFFANQEKRLAALKNPPAGKPEGGGK